MNVSNVSYINRIKENSFFVAYFSDMVELGFCIEREDNTGNKIKECIIDGNHKDNFNGLQQFHIFNELCEIRGVRTKKVGKSEDFGCQVIYKDKEMEQKKEYDWIDDYQLIHSNRWKQYQRNKDIFLKIRNYIEYNENGMIQIVDYRLLGFVVRNEGKEEMLAWLG